MTPDKAVGVGETVTYTPQKATSCLYGSTANVTLLEVIGGEDANGRMQSVNTNAKPERASDNFLLAKFRIEINASNVSYYYIRYVDFSSFSNDTRILYPRNYHKLDPSVEGSIDEGCREGWIVLEAEKGEQHPMILFDRDYTGYGGIWFKT
jgi:hypothetical protein